LDGFVALGQRHADLSDGRRQLFGQLDFQPVRAQEVVYPVQHPQRGVALDRVHVVLAVGDLRHTRDDRTFREIYTVEAKE